MTDDERDALVLYEYSRYADGCALRPSCLSCDLPRCVEESGAMDAIEAAWAAGIREETLWAMYRGPMRRVPRDVLEAHGIARGDQWRGKRLSPELHDAIVEAYQQGASLTRLSRQFCADGRTIRAILQGRGVWRGDAEPEKATA
jgi:hypothetical protein